MGVIGMGLYASNEPTLNFETLANQSYHVALEIIFYFGFLIAYAVKSPIIPLHTWLPDTHGEAHYSTCMLLAGILLKMGAYGIAYSSVSHMGFTIIGIASVNDMGLNRAILQIISCGFIGATLFFLAGTSYDRIRLMFYGYKQFNAKNSYFFDSGPRELFVSICIFLPVIGIGIYPNFVLSLLVDKVEAILSNYFSR
ncbi:hypothetical protein MKW92_040860 [Papaver armeniacum]|nr:hypothetical protein MKW92_040860 [Papaver armeniacum]